MSASIGSKRHIEECPLHLQEAASTLKKTHMQEPREAIQEQFDQACSSIGQMFSAIGNRLCSIESRVARIERRLFPQFPAHLFHNLGLTPPPFRERTLFTSDEQLQHSLEALQQDIAEQTSRQRFNRDITLAFSEQKTPLGDHNTSPIGIFNLRGINLETGRLKRTSQDTVCSFTIDTQEEERSQKLLAFCVFDGHGIKGEMVSAFAAEHIKDYLHASMLALNETGCAYEIANALICATLLLDAGYRREQQERRIEPHYGSTATIVLLSPQKIYASGLGDSRAIVARNAENSHEQLTFDQGLYDRRATQIALQRAVIHDYSKIPSRKNLRIAGTNVSGAIGNYHTEMPRGSGVKMLEVRPRVNIIDRKEEDTRLLVSSDGIYFRNTEPSTWQIGNLILDPSISASLLAETLPKLAREAGSYDDIGGMIVDLTADFDHLASYIEGEEVETEQSNQGDSLSLTEPDSASEKSDDAVS